MAEAQMRAQAERLGAVFKVAADLRLRREHARPARIRRERERVEMGLHIARATGIVVIAPGAADRTGFLEDQEIIDASLFETDTHGQPRKAAADDGDVAGSVVGTRGDEAVGQIHGCIHLAHSGGCAGVAFEGGDTITTPLIVTLNDVIVGIAVVWVNVLV
jgi:hypothetical protein